MGGRNERTNGRAVWCLAPALVIAAGLVSTAPAQSPARAGDAAPAQPTGTIHVTTAGVDLHAGPTGSYYRWGKIRAGEPVRVLETKGRWARVQAVGPAFEDLYGYIRVLLSDTGRVAIEDGGRTVVTRGKIDVIAPNMNNGGAADASWAMLARLNANERLTVLEERKTDRERVLKVSLPASASGWVNVGRLRAASAAESKQFQTLLAGGAGAARQPLATHPRSRDQGPNPVLGNAEENAPPVRTVPGTNRTGQALDPTAANPATDLDSLPNAPGEASNPIVPMVERRPTEIEKHINDLEVAFEALRNEPIESAEFAPLFAMYMDLARDTGDRPSIRDFALGRAEQLEIWQEVQERRQELARLRSKLSANSAEAAEVRLSLERSSDYVAVGRIAASTIYDGKRLPRLYRIQDVGSGRTVGYIRSTQEFSVNGLLGQLIGVVGTAEYHGGLRVNIVTAERIDLLAPKARPAADDETGAEANAAGEAAETDVAEPEAEAPPASEGVTGNEDAAPGR